MIQPEHLQYRLCYVDRNRFAWFTSIPLDKQWGDDWNDAPYEHNAGDPYGDHKVGSERIPHHLIKVAWDSDHITPNEDFVNSPYSVQSINAGNVAWLMVPRWRDHSAMRPVPAGATMADFIKIIKDCDGEIYLPSHILGAI